MIFLIRSVSAAFQIYTIMIFIKILGSWLPQFQQYRFMQFINELTDPYLNFFRRFIPPLGMIDFSPIVAFICLRYIEQIVMNILWSLAL